MEDALFTIRDRFHSEKQKPFAVDSSANGFRDMQRVCRIAKTETAF